MSKKSLFALLLALCLLVSAIGCSQPAATTTTPAPAESQAPADAPAEPAALYTAGSYTAEGAGKNAPVKVSVTFSDDAITDVQVVEHKETSGIADAPIERIPKAIVENQSLNIDTIAGATMTSDAILAAVADCVVQAGGDVEALKAVSVEKEEGTGEIVKEETEVIVVGAGGAGLAAAVQLGELNTKCIVLEKMPTTGGNTARSGAAYNAVDPELQAEFGIEDSIEKHIQQTYDGGDQIANLDLIRILCENSLETIKWLESYGTEWQHNITAVIGATWPRTHYPKNSVGSDFTIPLEKAATTQYNQKIMVDTRVTEIILEDGRAVGVKAVSTVDGTEYEFRASKGVIMATGGFAANIELCRSYNPKIPADIGTTNQPGATGDGIEIAKAAGAALEGIEYIQMLPIGSAPTVSTVIDSLIFVNQNGERFVREDGRRDQMSLAILDQPGQYMYMINDQRVVDANVSQKGLEDRLAAGTIYKADTLEELAEMIGVDADNLVKTVEEFNQNVKDKKVDQFGREVYDMTIEVGPFWASGQQKPMLHHTMGGVRIDTSARVLNEQNQPIPGLYAAGEVCGGIHGANRLGGNAVPDVFIFGRVAAKSAVEGK